MDGAHARVGNGGEDGFMPAGFAGQGRRRATWRSRGRARNKLWTAICGGDHFGCQAELTVIVADFSEIECHQAVTLKSAMESPYSARTVDM